MSEKRRDHKGRILRNGEGQRPDGKYIYRYIDSKGKRRTIYSWQLVATDKVPDGKKGTESLREAEKHLDIYEETKQTRVSTTTINAIFDKLLKTRKGLKHSSRVTYELYYDREIRNTIGVKPVDSIVFSDLEDFYTTLLYDRGLKPTSVQMVHQLLWQVFQRAIRDKVILYNPAVGVWRSLSIEKMPRTRHALTQAEQKELVRFVNASSEYKRYGPLLTVLLGTGMRINEALGLRWCDCDFAQGYISVDHALVYTKSSDGKWRYSVDLPKTAAGVRKIPMLQEVRKALEAERELTESLDHTFSINGYSNFVFLSGLSRPMRCNTFSVKLKEMATAYNKTANGVQIPLISPHILRHSFCTRMFENGADIKVVQTLMGHSSSRTTMDIYNYVTEERVRNSMVNMEGKLVLG